MLLKSDGPISGFAQNGDAIAHPALGWDAIEQAERELGVEIPFLKFAKEIAYGHQERWDGSGYPEVLSGEAIPVSARLMAVAARFADTDEDVKKREHTISLFNQVSHSHFG